MVQVDPKKLKGASAEVVSELTIVTNEVNKTLQLLYNSMQKGLIPTVAYIDMRDSLLETLKSKLNDYLS